MQEAGTMLLKRNLSMCYLNTSLLWHLGGAGFVPELYGFDIVYSGKANTSFRNRAFSLKVNTVSLSPA